MSDNEPLTPSLELIATIMNELAGEIGAMEPADPQRADFLNELSDLMQVRRFLRVDGDHLVGEWMDELAREMATLKLGDSRRAQFVQHIKRLRIY